jgi:hypothetical protein
MRTQRLAIAVAYMLHTRLRSAIITSLTDPSFRFTFNRCAKKRRIPQNKPMSSWYPILLRSVVVRQLACAYISAG